VFFSYPLFSGSVPNGLQYTPCGKYIVYPLGSVVVVRSISKGNHAFLHAPSDTEVSCLAVSKDGRFLASGHKTKSTTKAEAVIWDLKKAIKDCDEKNTSSQRCQIHCLKQHQGKVQSVDFGFDSKFLVSLGGQDDNDLVVWDVETGVGICGSPAANDSTHCVKWLNNRNDRFVTCGTYHFKVWQVCQRKLHPIDASMGTIRRVMRSVCIAHNDNFAYAGSETGEVLMFAIDRDDPKPFNEPESLRPALKGYNRDRFGKGVKSVACVVNPSTGNTNVIAGAGDGTVQILNPKLQRIESHKAQLSGAVSSITLSPSGKSFLAGTELSQRYSIDIATFTEELRSTGHFGEIYDVKFPKNCSELFVTASTEDIRIWNTAKKQELLRIRVPNLTCRAIEVTPSGTSVLSGWSDGKIRAFYPESGKAKFIVPDAHSDEVTALATCNDDDLGNEWRMVSGGKDGRVRVWKVTNSHRSMIHSMKEHRGSVSSVVCNQGGTQVVSASTDGSCIVWDLQRGVRIHALFEPTVFHGVLYHPDESQYLTCGANAKLGYWDAFDGNAIRMIDGGDSEMTCLDIRPNDGCLFVSGSADKLVKVWHYDDGITIGCGRGHSGRVNSVAISPNQRHVVSVGSEGGVFIWSLDGVDP